MNFTKDFDGVTGMETTPPSIEMEFEMKMAKKMHFWSSTLLASVFIAVGITGNILSIIIWNRKKMHSSTGTYLIGQAIADTGLLVFFFLTDSIPMMLPSIKTAHSYAVFYCYVGFPLFFWFILTSIWITVGVTIDRYILVCWITRAKTWCNNKRAIISMVMITIICLIVDGPHFFTFRPLAIKEFNETNSAYTETEYGSGNGSRMYEFWVHCMFMVLGPWMIIFILNILILQRVGQSSRNVAQGKSKSMSVKSKKSETRMTRLLLTVTFTFLVLLAFQCITQCFFMLQKGEKHVVSEAFSIAKLGVVINSSVNFFLYCLSGRKFRHELMDIFSCCQLVPLRANRVMTLTSDTSSTAFSAERFSSTSEDGIKVGLAVSSNCTEYMYTVDMKEKLKPNEELDSFTHL